MQIDIQSRGFAMTDALLNYAQKRLLLALSFCSDHVNRVVIRLSDVNGPRGGADKRCHIQVVIAGMPDVVVEDTKVDLYAAINRAVNRSKRTVTRKIGKQLSLIRQR